MDQVTKSDLYRYGGLTGVKGFFRAFFAHPGFRYTYLLRKAASCEKKSVKWYFYALLKNNYSYKYGYQIALDTQIGEGFLIAHFGNVVINGRVVIGKYCNIAQGVTIGKTNRGRLKGTPVIGDYVWIGTNAVIVGKINIGSNVLIAPNAFVNMDVPNNSIIVGNPAKIISRLDATEGYINNVLTSIPNFLN